MADAQQWYYARNGQQAGPISLDALRAMVAAGQLSSGDLVWREGMPDWKPLGSLPEFGGASTTATAPVGVRPYVGAPGPAPMPYQPYPSPRAADASGMATAAFVLSLISLACCGFVLGIVAVVLGITALNTMSRTGNQRGRGLAIAAIVIGAIAFAAHLGFVGARWHTIHRHFNIP